MSKVRGSFHVDGRRSLTHIVEADDKLTDVGFRLAGEPGFETFRGSNFDRSWLSKGELPRTMGTSQLGFRLTREGE